MIKLIKFLPTALKNAKKDLDYEVDKKLAESEAKIKNQGYQESGSSITKTQIVESRKMDGMIK